MEVEVILREVREADGGELGADQAPLRDRDRRRLHGAGLVAGVDHRAQRALQVGRLGRRQARGLASPADAALDRSDQAARPLRGVQDRREQQRGRGLAVGAGDADDVEVAARMPVERVGQSRHARARVGADDLRHAQAGSSRSTSTATAPLATASGACAWPSARAPRSAQNSDPGPLRSER